MNVVDVWNGRRASALRRALRLTNEGFAEKLGAATRTVAKWAQNPDAELTPDIQLALDTVLENAGEKAQSRFALLLGDGSPQQPEATTAGEPQAALEPAIEQRIRDDVHINSAIDWLAKQARLSPASIRRDVTSMLAALDHDSLRERGHRRGRVEQCDVSAALQRYYADAPKPFGTYTARVGDTHTAKTSLLTRPEWLDLRCHLVDEHDEITLDAAAADVVLQDFDERLQNAAISRIAETLALDTRLVNAPLYRLLEIAPEPGQLRGRFGMTNFVQYALTLDLLEGELIDALAMGRATEPGSLPLRDRYLPTVKSVLNVEDRTSVGGPLALCAFARPARGRRKEPDYLLLVQERGGRVLNAARRLAVIPKSFHEPLVDYREDTQLGLTLARELEEELFGREDVDSTIDSPRRADPMHRSRLSAPMGWLADNEDSWRLECTGLGLNLVSGNYEFASLLVVNDERFWEEHGGSIEANWESDSLRQYSSLDADLVTSLVKDAAWSNEGLFAFLQGLRRLSELDPSRTNLPAIEWEINA